MWKRTGCDLSGNSRNLRIWMVSPGWLLREANNSSIVFSTSQETRTMVVVEDLGMLREEKRFRTWKDSGIPGNWLERWTWLLRENLKKSWIVRNYVATNFGHELFSTIKWFSFCPAPDKQARILGGDHFQVTFEALKERRTNVLERRTSKAERKKSYMETLKGPIPPGLGMPPMPMNGGPPPPNPVPNSASRTRGKAPKPKVTSIDFANNGLAPRGDVPTLPPAALNPVSYHHDYQDWVTNSLWFSPPRASYRTTRFSCTPWMGRVELIVVTLETGGSQILGVSPAPCEDPMTIFPIGGGITVKCRLRLPEHDIINGPTAPTSPLEEIPSLFFYPWVQKCIYLFTGRQRK